LWFPVPIGKPRDSAGAAIGAVLVIGH
jgi:hypothetical protein